jgi:FAD/FMN-containing dehydrogenase
MTSYEQTAADYARRRDAAAAAVRQAGSASVGLRKSTSNLFRDRAALRKQRIEADAFNHVLRVDPAAQWVDAEGMTTYEALVEATLAHGVMPAVVPQLKTITLGGAAVGVGIEATSFRHGLVHETLLEMDVLTGTGEVVLARPDNEHRDLFFGLPNSYGTLGYALRLRARTLPVKPYVRVEHHPFENAERFFAALAQACGSDADFVDGVVFARDALYLSVARCVDAAPATSDYTFEHMYYRSIADKPIDHLTARDYIWRWDTDWFWCSKNLGAQVPWIRRLYGRKRLNSRTYTRIMRWSSRWKVRRGIDRLRGLQSESVIQDVDIPLANAAEFLAFFEQQIGITPIWICPVAATPTAHAFPLFARAPDTLYVNFGFWDVVRTREKHAAGHFNRLIEAKVIALGGIKSLYSDSYFSREQFAAAYGGADYTALKARYDPDSRLGDLYAKCVLRQ